MSQLQQSLPSAPTNGHGRQSNGNELAYIDQRVLTRDCVAAQLAVLLPEFSIETCCSAFEIQTCLTHGPPNCIVFHAHSENIGSRPVAEELTILREVLSDVPILMLSNIEAPENVAHALRYGVAAYIPTSLALETLAQAVRLVRAGCSVMPLGARSSPSTKTETEFLLASTSDRVHLTPRQLEVLRRLWQGKQNKLIAYELQMSEGTVKVHVKHIMQKLHVRSRTQVALIFGSLQRDTPTEGVDNPDDKSTSK